jgi:hypothetical protein
MQTAPIRGVLGIVDQEVSFGCDLGIRFDVTAVLEVDPFAVTR